MRTVQPEIVIDAVHHKHIKKVIAEAFRNRDRVAPFLSAELRRASISGDKTLTEKRVVPGRQVSYRLDWGPPTPFQTLVYPEDLHDPTSEIPLLSPIGTALLGLAEGDQILVFLSGSGFHKLQVEGVS
jgi:regulator of nucleoside diphosphate kinase